MSESFKTILIQLSDQSYNRAVGLLASFCNQYCEFLGVLYKRDSRNSIAYANFLELWAPFLILFLINTVLLKYHSNFSRNINHSYSSLIRE